MVCASLRIHSVYKVGPQGDVTGIGRALEILALRGVPKVTRGVTSWQCCLIFPAMNSGPDWPHTSHVVEDGLELLNPLPPHTRLSHVLLCRVSIAGPGV